MLQEGEAPAEPKRGSAGASPSHGMGSFNPKSVLTETRFLLHTILGFALPFDSEFAIIRANHFFRFHFTFTTNSP
jgi:hypothetical protein